MKLCCISIRSLVRTLHKPVFHADRCPVKMYDIVVVPRQRHHQGSLCHRVRCCHQATRGCGDQRQSRQEFLTDAVMQAAVEKEVPAAVMKAMKEEAAAAQQRTGLMSLGEVILQLCRSLLVFFL